MTSAAEAICLLGVFCGTAEAVPLSETTKKLTGAAQLDRFVDLGLVDGFDAGEGVDFGEGLVGAEAEDAREAEGESAGVARAAHDVVEGDFEDDEGLDGAEVALVFERVGFEEFGEVGDFGVGDAGVGFADVEEFA